MTADLDRPEGCPIPYGTLLSNKNWSKDGGKRAMLGAMHSSSQETTTCDECIAFLCLNVQLFLYQVKCLYINS
mgnify:CR=1 FL=1